MTTTVATQKNRQVTTIPTNAIETALVGGDLSQLLPEQRLQYYNQVCESVGLNPLTKPFEYTNLNGRLSLYAKKDCTDQLRKVNNVNIESIEQKREGDLYIVTATASLPSGRKDTDIGAVAIANLKNDYLANAIMKAITKAKRRVTLSICGLGMLDESEIDSVPDAVPTNEIEQQLESPKIEQNGHLETVNNGQYATSDQTNQIKSLFVELGVPHEAQQAAMEKRNVTAWRSLTSDQAVELIKSLEAKKKS